METDLAGKILGDFEVEALLGRGSMARVYQARQVSLRRHVALKVLQEGLFTPGESVARFLREAEAMARLEHPNIVPVYAAGEETPYYFFAMRLVRGGTLDKSLRQAITRATALEWANDICRGLAFAHTAGVVHRDLKPSNVLIHGGVALLSDFGLAHLRDLSTITQLGDVMGTPLYMSPEQTLGESAGPPADCFALGIILYQMLCGQHPFARPENQEEPRTRLFQRIQNAECKQPSELDAEFPRELERVILRALARRPEDRYPDAAAMQRELEEASHLVTGLERVIRCAPEAEDQREHFPGEDSISPSAMTREEGVGPGLGSTESVAPPARDGRGPTPLRATTPKPVLPKGQTGRLTFGRYSVLKEVGHGGQGVVYQARDPVLDRIVALKVLRYDAMTQAHMLDLFWNEARVAARLQHPHIITIYDFGMEEQSPYLTMQFVGGPSLDRLLEPGRPLPLDFALQVLAQVAGALAFAHQAGVIHLDVKPGNILLHDLPQAAPAPNSERGAPDAVLTDFTMARLRDAVRREGEQPLGLLPAGTISYASPEQLVCSHEVLSPASDIFSLGAVFYEMLTGKRLFSGETTAVSRDLLLNAGIAPPSAQVPGLPAEVDELCLRMLTHAASRRLQEAAEVVQQAEALKP